MNAPKRVVSCLLFVLGSTAALQAAQDPGVRGGAAAAGAPIDNLASEEMGYFSAGQDEFAESEGIDEGLGPRFNLDSCSGCHLQPAIGGSSPPVNPQVAVATAFGARNTVPAFITLNGPVREARFKYRRNGERDGGVHALFVISGREDSTGKATDCNIVQDDFAAHAARDNVAFRIPTPTFGLGLMESIPDRSLRANLAANAGVKWRFGISGRFNRAGNDGTIARFGWKAQNVSLLVFSGEAYNVEMGVTNEAFMTERDEDTHCQYAVIPNTVTTTSGGTALETVSAIDKFAFFMRSLAAATPSSDTPGGADSIARGRQVFAGVGCALCHSPQLKTGNSSIAALRDQTVNLFSDLALHRMGPRLADNIQQGVAEGDEFRTAPLWGLGQRIFFLHDGRTSDLMQAIQEHASGGNRQFGPSEANRVVGLFNMMNDQSKQDLLNFLRSL